MNSSALWGRDGLPRIKAKAVRPLLWHNTQPHPLWKYHAFALLWLKDTGEISISTETSHFNEHRETGSREPKMSPIGQREDEVEMAESHENF